MVTSTLIMGSPTRRQINPITRCWDQPRYGYAGTDDGRGTDQRLDTKRLTLMSGCSSKPTPERRTHVTRGMTHVVHPRGSRLDEGVLAGGIEALCEHAPRAWTVGVRSWFPSQCCGCLTRARRRH